MPTSLFERKQTHFVLWRPGPKNNTFEGLKTSGNTDLHITSTRYDEPMCLTVLGHTEVVVTLHGEHSEEDGEGVFLGGLDTMLGERIRTVLTRKGFDVRMHQDPDCRAASRATCATGA